MIDSVIQTCSLTIIELGILGRNNYKPILARTRANNESMGHGSNGLHFLDGSVVHGSKPLTQ